ncbi:MULTISPECIES: hypothetical protein [Methylomonas]|uniref:Uncharacterized protein n=1 Tax=Methylomonas koyamae TaxID=702114 RepID=A0A177NL40_9GAMM|nr:hypothetical protein [Methylomonas koyamae]OAI17740.1 hypothetical protein A1355_07175 [Methylomonas koyamae]
MTPNNQTNTATAAAATTQGEAVQSARLYLTVQQFNQKHPAFPVGTLRHQIFNEETNGLKKSGAIVRNGRRVLINEPKYFAWLESQNERAA